MTVVQCPNCYTIVRVTHQNLEFCSVCQKILVVSGKLQPSVKPLSDNCRLCDQLAQPSVCVSS